MKHGRHITESHLEPEAAEIEKFVSKLCTVFNKVLPENGMVIEHAPYDGMAVTIKAKFMDPYNGRDWKNSRINCTGFGCNVYLSRGRDEKHDENGHFIWENGKVAVEGEPYTQYEVQFWFSGTEYRYRCRKREAIQDRTMKVYDYDDDLQNIDFTQNFEYLKNIH